MDTPINLYHPDRVAWGWVQLGDKKLPVYLDHKQHQLLYAILRRLGGEANYIISDLAGLTADDGALIIGDGTNFVTESGNTARTSLGLGTGDSPQFTAVEVGHATDTTVARSSAGNLTIEGNVIYRAGGTDVPVTDGGTGASTAAGARTNLDVPSNSEAILDAIIAAKGDLIVGSANDTPAILSVGTDGHVLTADAASTNGVKWAVGGGTPALDDLTDVVITTPADGQVLTYDSGSGDWVNENSAAGFSNPMTTAGDIIIGGVAGAGDRLGIGSAGDVLTVTAGAPAWAAPSGGVDSGTSFPGSPSDGDLFFRTDRGILYYYVDSLTAWHSTQIFTQPLTIGDALLPRTATTASLLRGKIPHVPTYDLYLEKFEVGIYQTSASSATNYFTLQLKKVVAGTVVNLVSVNSQNNGNGEWTQETAAIDALVGTTQVEFEVDANETGTVTAMYCVACVTYRLVG